ncbi:MAG: hypothetical protein ACOCYE_11205 [Pseudomonadota bacterium]
MTIRAFTLALALGALMLAAAAPTARAAMLYDELFDGELPTAQGAVPVLQASFGSNKVRLLTGPNDHDPIDVFDLALPSGGVLESVLIEAYRPGRNNASSSFGPVVSNGLIFGGVRLTTERIGDDIVSEFAGLSPASGPFRFGFGEDNGPAGLQVDFVVTPLPAAGAFLATALVAVGALRARRRQSA